MEIRYSKEQGLSYWYREASMFVSELGVTKVLLSLHAKGLTLKHRECQQDVLEVHNRFVICALEES